MSEAHTNFSDLGAALDAKEFADVDLALRRGQHIDRNDAAWYEFLSDAQDVLEPFYRRYGCELIHKADGYFYLLPTGEKLPRRHLSVGDMLVGQAMALLFLDPRCVAAGGIVEQGELLAQLDGIVGTAALISVFHTKKRRYDQRVAEEAVRKKVGEAARRLAQLGFADVLDGNRLRLRSPLMRFAEPARGGAPTEALQRLLERGEVALTEEAYQSALDEQRGDQHADVLDESADAEDDGDNLGHDEVSEPVHDVADDQEH